MVLIELVRVVIMGTLVVGGELQIKPEALEEYKEICKNITLRPFFDHSMVVRKTWKVYYNWNKKLDTVCPKLTFKYPNGLIIKRFQEAMGEYLKKEPSWHDAVLLMILYPSREMLLFDDRSGIPGRFLGVPIMKEEDIFDMFKGLPTVPMFNLAMKLIHRGKYLILSDCGTGITSLAVQQAKRPKRIEINDVAKSFHFGDGFPCCINEPDPGET